MIAAVLTGPNYWAPNHDEHSIEVFANFGDAIEALIDRHRSNGRYEQHIDRLDGTQDAALFPAFDTGTGFECYILPDGDDTHPHSDEWVEEALTAVHGGCFDWRLTLTGDDGDDAVLAVPA